MFKKNAATNLKHSQMLASIALGIDPAEIETVVLHGTNANAVGEDVFRLDAGYRVLFVDVSRDEMTDGKSALVSPGTGEVERIRNPWATVGVLR